MTELLDTKAIASILGVTHAYARDRVVRNPSFPRPCLALSQKIKRWSATDVEAWLSRERQRQAR